MREFIAVLKFTLALVISIIFVWAGVHLAFAYYMTDQNVHDIFAVFGPVLVLVGSVIPFVAVHEVSNNC